MRTETSPAQTPTRLADYRPPDWLVDRVSLVFDLAPAATLVRARIAFRRNPARADEGPAPLRLDGRKLRLRGAEIDGTPLGVDAIEQDGEGLSIAPEHLPGDSFEWLAETEIDPSANTELEGLYLSKGMYCTQCEAEGFRKITFYPDRPDVMAPFTVRIEAPADVPVLLSNGNPGATGATDGGRHFAEWDDPWPKPAYLFALVAGDLVAQSDAFTTASGREVALKLWVRRGDEDRCAYAMDALKRSMAWDERTHGREYDLDIFQIVAVDDFNMGAMENKGLNVFNSKYVLASPESATDQDFENIEAIVAHEYFHNWTGNRITCRDWFQLCLKEGLTVFRDQMFSADARSAALQRIGDVKTLRARQFPEDQGPLAHPVRPEEYIEINNFYTATVYEKGAEVIRMLHTMLGAEGYRRALDLYFERHDGEACTIEDFRACFEETSGRDLTQFALWWSQAGTPKVTVEDAWDGTALTLTLTQETAPTPGQAEKRPLHMPIAIGVIGADGREILPTRVIELTEARQEVRLETGPQAEPPVASVNRGFSAPVILAREMSDETRTFLLAHETDPFNRWEAAHRLGILIARRIAEEGRPIPENWAPAHGALLRDPGLDPAFKARAMEMPSQDEVAGETAAAGLPADPDAIFGALKAMRAHLGFMLDGALTAAYAAMEDKRPYTPDAEGASRRSLRNRALSLLIAADGGAAHAMAEAQFDTADNMTDSLAALTVLVHHGAPGAPERLEAFYERWKGDPIVIDKWLSVQATAPLPDALARIAALTEHDAFVWKNPNRFRSLIGAFAMANPVRFHDPSGAGYRFVADWLLRLDPVNPQTTARLAGAFESWRRYDAHRQGLIRAELDRIAGADGLSRNTREIVERMLRRE